MTARSPVERGAEAIAGEYDRRGHLKPGAWWSAEHRREPLRGEARAVFESIDVEALDAVIQKNWISTPGEFRNALLAYLLEGTDQ